MKFKISLKKFILLVVSLAILGLLSFYFISKNKPLDVKTVKSEIRDIVKTVSLSGVIEAEEHVDLAFAASGTISKINVKEGDMVSSGQILGQLDSTILYNTYAQNRDLYEKAKAQLKTYMETYKDDPATANVNSDDIYWSKYNEYQKSIDSSMATATASYASLSNSTVKSPIGGTLVDSRYKAGEYAVAGTTAFKVIDPSTFYFKIDGDQEDIGQIKIDQKVNVDLDTYPDKKIEGTIYFVAENASVDSSGNSIYEIKVNLPADSGVQIKLGMEGTAGVILENKIKRLSVNSDAVYEDNDKSYVLKLQDGIAKQQEVKKGFEGDDFIEIESGLTENDIVLMNPSKSLINKRVSPTP